MALLPRGKFWASCGDSDSEDEVSAGADPDASKKSLASGWLASPQHQIPQCAKKYTSFEAMASRFLAAATLLAGFLALATLVSCNTEGDILYAQRQVWYDPNNVLQSWDPTLVNPCTWFHVTCNNDNSVIRVDLGNAGLGGTLIPALGGLKNLQYLELYSNRLNGTIPATLGNLTNLISLDLYDNLFSGNIPTSLGALRKLRFLRLNDNKLTGTVPSEVVSLVTHGNLTELNVAKNDLTGTVRSSRFRVTTIIRDKLKTA